MICRALAVLQTTGNICWLLSIVNFYSIYRWNGCVFAAAVMWTALLARRWFCDGHNIVHQSDIKGHKVSFSSTLVETIGQAFLWGHNQLVLKTTFEIFTKCLVFCTLVSTISLVVPIILSTGMLKIPVLKKPVDRFTNSPVVFSALQNKTKDIPRSEEGKNLW